MHAYAHAHRHTAVFVRREDTFLNPLWTLTLEEEYEEITKGITRRTSVEVQSWIWRVLTCVNFLIWMAVKWPKRLYIPSLCLLECLNQDRTRRGSEPLCTTCCLDPSVDTWGDDAGGRRDVFALPAVCAEPAFLGEDLIIDHWSTWNKPVSNRHVPAHALIEDCGIFNADWFGGFNFLG